MGAGLYATVVSDVNVNISVSYKEIGKDYNEWSGEIIERKDFE